MRWVVVATLLAGAGGAAIRAAPAPDAAEFNRQTAATCADWRLARQLNNRSPFTDLPAMCRAPAERTDWETEWLTVAAVLAVGAAVVGVMPRHR